MRISHLRLAAVALTSGILLGGCAYDMYGDPYGYGYGYPGSGVSIGVGYGGGYGGYGYGSPYGGYYGSYGYPYGGYGGYGYDPFGWYGDYYYPGVGGYVYDRSRTRHVWSGDQQRYWTQRRQQWQSHSGTTMGTGENWSGWDRSHRHDGTSTNGRTWTHGSGGWTGSNGSTNTTSTTSTPDGTRHRHHHGDHDN